MRSCHYLLHKKRGPAFAGPLKILLLPATYKIIPPRAAPLCARHAVRAVYNSVRRQQTLLKRRVKSIVLIKYILQWIRRVGKPIGTGIFCDAGLSTICYSKESCCNASPSCKYNLSARIVSYNGFSDAAFHSEFDKRLPL